VLIAAAVAGATLGGALLVDAVPTAARTRPRDGGVRPVHPVGVRVLALEDPTRPTPADPEGRFAASSTRRLTTSVFYPAALGIPGTTSTTALAFGDDGPAAMSDARAAAGRYPVILFSGGAPGTPADYEPLLATWAKLGYVVFSVDLYGKGGRPKVILGVAQGEVYHVTTLAADPAGTTPGSGTGTGAGPGTGTGPGSSGPDRTGPVTRIIGLPGVRQPPTGTGVRRPPARTVCTARNFTARVRVRDRAGITTPSSQAMWRRWDSKNPRSR